jgi:hypothetical protein
MLALEKVSTLKPTVAAISFYCTLWGFKKFIRVDLPELSRPTMIIFDLCELLLPIITNFKFNLF